MKFKDLSIDQEFEFDHSNLKMGCLQIAHGPWRKVSSRKYTESEGSGVYRYHVGSINAEVAEDMKCGGRRAW